MKKKIILWMISLFYLLPLQAQKIQFIVNGGNDTSENALAKNAKLQTANFVVDTNDDIYIAENYRIRKIDHVTGKIKTVVGNGIPGTSADGMYAGSSIKLTTQIKIYNGELYWIEGNRIRRLHAQTAFAVPVMNTVVGDTNAGYSGDGGLAKDATLNAPSDFCFDLLGNMYIADYNNEVIRKVSTSGIITTIAGIGPGGTPPADPEGMIATSTSILPFQVQTDYNNTLHFSMHIGTALKLCRILSNGKIHVETNTNNYDAGGEFGFPPNQIGYYDGTRFCFDTSGNAYYAIRPAGYPQKGKLIRATVQNASSNDGYVEWLNYNLDSILNGNIYYETVAFDADQNLLIGFYANNSNPYICKIIMPKMKTILGNGSNAFTPDGVNVFTGSNPISLPQNVQYDSINNRVYFSEANRIRKIEATGILSTVVGNGFGPTLNYHIPNGSMATSVPIITNLGSNTPFILGPNHSIYFSSWNYIYKMDSLGVVTTIAGNGQTHNTDDNILATNAGVGNVQVLALTPNGELIYADNDQHSTIHVIDNLGILHTIAGTAGLLPTDTANGLLAKNTYLQNHVNGITFDSLGNLFYSSWHKVRKIDITTQTVSTFAGTGFPADQERPSAYKLDACLNYPSALFFEKGYLFVAEDIGNRIRKIGDRTYTYAGKSKFTSNDFTLLYNNQNVVGYCCDGIPAESATMNRVRSICPGKSGSLFLIDKENHSLRMIYPDENKFYAFPTDTLIANQSPCGAIYNYNVESIEGAFLSYQFSGATLGSGTGTGSGSFFNNGVTTVTIFSNLFGFPQVSQSFQIHVVAFNITVLDKNNDVIPDGSMGTSLANGTNMGQLLLGATRVVPTFKITTTMSSFLKIDSVTFDGVEDYMVVGIGNPDSITYTTNVAWNLMLNATDLGVHNFTVKIYKAGCGVNPYTFQMQYEVVSPKIAKIEAILNTDSGPGAALNATITNFNNTLVTFPCDSVNANYSTLQFTIPSSLLTGYQILGLRTMNEAGVWSVINAEPITLIAGNATSLIQAEFFLDSQDPGLGNANAISIPSNNGSLTNVTMSTMLNNLTSGYHNLNVRFKNNLGIWTPLSIEPFDAKPIANNQVAMEYFLFSTDPGPGNGIAIPVNQIADTFIQIKTPCASNGQQQLRFRVKNNLGIWSVQSHDTININGMITPQIAANQTTLCNGSVALYRTEKKAFGVIDSWKENNLIFATAGLDTIWVNNPGDYSLQRTCFLQNNILTSNSISINMGSCHDTLNINLRLQGYMDVNGTMLSVLTNEGVGTNVTETDTVFIELHDANNKTNILYQSKTILSTEGSCSLHVPQNLLNTTPFYIVIKHRNSIETWSANPVLFTAQTTYDFSTAASQAYGNNQIEVEPGVFALYSGDINQDGFIDSFDFPLLDTDIFNGVSGMYVNTDLNGDGFVDSFDFPVFDVNSFNGVSVMTP